MVRWAIVICAALLAPVADAAESAAASAAPGKVAKRRAKPAKPPAPPAASPKPLHLGLHGPSLNRRHTDWHLESVPAPGLNPQASASGLRALAMVGPLNGEQRVEFGLAPLVPLKLPSSVATGLDGPAGTGSAKKTSMPAAQVYLRYSW